MYGPSESDSRTPNQHATINHEYSTSENNNYTSRHLTFSGDSAEFEWWKSGMYTHIIGLDDELCDIVEDGIDILGNRVGMVTDRKKFTSSQKNINRKHHRLSSMFGSFSTSL